MQIVSGTHKPIISALCVNDNVLALYSNTNKGFKTGPNIGELLKNKGGFIL